MFKLAGNQAGGLFGLTPTSRTNTRPYAFGSGRIKAPRVSFLLRRMTCSESKWLLALLPPRLPSFRQWRRRPGRDQALAEVQAARLEAVRAAQPAGVQQGLPATLLTGSSRVRYWHRGT